MSSTNYCVAAGVIGALAGACCKAASKAKIIARLLYIDNSYVANYIPALFYLGFVVLNMRSWVFYVKGMERVPSLQATVIASSTNSLTMGCLAWLLFEESLTINWIIGVLFMLCGVYLLSKAPIPKTKTN